MDRLIVQPASIPLDTDILSIQRNAMIALGYLAQAALGTGTIVDGLACTPTSPASMVVNIGQGAIFALSEIDATAFGSLPLDTDPLVKFGINAVGVTPFTLTAPGTSGQSINYLIEAAFEEADGTPVVLPYYNPANPAAPYSGPGNSGAAQDTVRKESVQLQLKAGAAAATGTQTTPAVDSGWVGLYVVTVNYGMTTVIAGDIAVAAGAPFLPQKLPQTANVNGSSSEVFNVANATTSTEAPSRGQVMNTAPIGAYNVISSGTSVSTSTASFVAPSNGYALVFASATSSTAGNLASDVTTSSLSGLTTVTQNQLGTIDTTVSTIQMTAGQSSIFTLTAAQNTSAELAVSLMVFFIPTP